MAKATENQHRQFSALTLTSGKRQDWDKDKLQIILDLPSTEFNTFLSMMINNYEVPAPEPIIITPSTGPLILPKTFNPATFIGNGWTIWKGPIKSNGLEGEEEQDQRSLLLTEIDFIKLTKDGNFLTGLEGSEKVVTGEVKRARLISKMIQADARAAQALYEEVEQKNLRFLYDTLGVTWMEFLGTTLRHSDGTRCALYLYRQDVGSWDWNYRWLGSNRRADDPALSLVE